MNKKWFFGFTGRKIKVRALIISGLISLSFSSFATIEAKCPSVDDLNRTIDRSSGFVVDPKIGGLGIVPSVEDFDNIRFVEWLQMDVFTGILYL